MSVAVEYQAPRYEPQPGTAWYHVLYGHVPGHQLDFIYRPETPYEKLKRQHFSDLQLVIRHLQPTPNHSPAFAICNLSAYDTQHRPGHGGLGLVASMRIQEMRDHAGRVAPVFAHAALIVDAALTWEFLTDATKLFLAHFCRLSPTWYCAYYDRNQPLEVEYQTKHIAQFADLPREIHGPPPPRWRSGRQHPGFRQLLIACREDSPADLIQRTACRLAAVLYHSGVRWLAISDGQDLDIPGLYTDSANAAILIRFIYGMTNAVHPAGALVMPLSDVPVDEDKLASLFGLVRVSLPTILVPDASQSTDRIGERQAQPEPDSLPPQSATSVERPLTAAGRSGENRAPLIQTPEPTSSTTPAPNPRSAADRGTEDARELIVSVISMPPKLPKTTVSASPPRYAASPTDISYLQTEALSAVEGGDSNSTDVFLEEPALQPSSRRRLLYWLAVASISSLAVAYWTVMLIRAYHPDLGKVVSVFSVQDKPSHRQPPENAVMSRPSRPQGSEIKTTQQPNILSGQLVAEELTPSHPTSAPPNLAMAAHHVEPPPGIGSAQPSVAVAVKPIAPVSPTKKPPGKHPAVGGATGDKKRSHAEAVQRYREILLHCQQVYCSKLSTDLVTCNKVKGIEQGALSDFEDNPSESGLPDLIHKFCKDFE